MEVVECREYCRQWKILYNWRESSIVRVEIVKYGENRSGTVESGDS